MFMFTKQVGHGDACLSLLKAAYGLFFGVALIHVEFSFWLFTTKTLI